MRGNRGTSTLTEAEAPIVAAPESDEGRANGGPASQEANQTKRAARPPIDVGEVTVSKSTRTDITSRPSRITSDPVYLAVQAAEFDEAVDLHVAPNKVEAVKKRLRTSSDPKHLNVGMTIVPGTPASDQEGKVIVTFVKREARQTRNRKADATSTTAAE